MFKGFGGGSWVDAKAIVSMHNVATLTIFTCNYSLFADTWQQCRLTSSSSSFLSWHYARRMRLHKNMWYAKWPFLTTLHSICPRDIRKYPPPPPRMSRKYTVNLYTDYYVSHLISVLKRGSLAVWSSFIDALHLSVTDLWVRFVIMVCFSPKMWKVGSTYKKCM